MQGKAQPKATMCGVQTIGLMDKGGNISVVHDKCLTKTSSV